jgi:PST family polysaccharide transporter
MRSILKATAVLSSSAVVTVFVGVLTAKAWALMIGPRGLGLAGVLQAFLALLTMLGGLAGGAGLVRAISISLASNSTTAAGHVRTAASVVTAALSVGLGALLILLRQPASALLGNAVHDIDVVLIAVALVFSLGTTVVLSILNGYQRVAAMARAAIVTSVLSAVGSIAVVYWLGLAGVSVSVLLAAFLGWLVGLMLVRREIGRPTERTSLSEGIAAARRLVAFGGGYVVALIPGTAVLFLIPVLVLNAIGLDQAGFYRAAAAISVGYLGVLIRAMALEYYPRLAAAAEEPGAVSRLVRQQQWVVMVLGVPLVLGAAAALPIVVPLLYTTEFGPTIDLLRWLLLGEIPRFLAWTLAFVLVARGSMRNLFLVELAAAVTQVLLAAAAIRVVGLVGVGIAYAITTATYYVYVRLVVGRGVPIHLSRRVQLVTVAITAYLLVLALVGEREIGPATIAGIFVAIGAVAVSGFLIWREFRGGDRLETVSQEPPGEQAELIESSRPVTPRGELDGFSSDIGR